jgi:hypothetical protein
MRIFLSYASEQRDLADDLAQRLNSAGIDVFYDRESLEPGASFDARIRQAVARADVFVFLASPDSLRPGTYALTELGFARQRWPRATGRVITVVVGDMPIATLPGYLRSVTVLHPQGDAIAETVAAISRLASGARKKRLLQFALGSLVLAAAAAPLWPLLRKAQAPEEIRDVTVARVDGGYRFTATLRNTAAESVVAIRLYPEADRAGIRFPSSFEWVELGPGRELAATVLTGLEGAEGEHPFKWRLCWVGVNALDMELAKDVKPIDRFLDQRSRTMCSGYRPWIN